MFLILSAMTALLECGSIFLGKCLGYSPGGILTLCLAYQFGNLFPIPFCLRKKALLNGTYLAFVLLCIARFLDTRPPFQWTFYLIGIMTLSCAMQSVRSEMKAQTSTDRKRTARIVGFALAPVMMYAPCLILSVCCLIVLFSLKHTIQASASDSRLSAFFKAMVNNDCCKIMLWHQLHYFIYAYAMILVAYQIIGKPFLTMLLFACTWLTYLLTEPVIKYVCRCCPKLIYDAKSLSGNTTIIVIGHTFLLLILLLLPNVSGGVFIPLWILAGFGGGTVFAISALCRQSSTYRKEYLTFTENIGHFAGTAVAVLWISLFPQNIRHISYLSAICVFIVLLLSIKKYLSRKERKIENSNCRS